MEKKWHSKRANVRIRDDVGDAIFCSISGRDCATDEKKRVVIPGNHPENKAFRERSESAVFLNEISRMVIM